MQFETVIYEKREGIAVATLNRPDRANAINGRMRDELSKLWGDFKHDDALRVAVVTAAGTEAFCAGLDLEEWASRPVRRSLSERDEGVRRITTKQRSCWKPVICAVNGECVGGGLHFVVDADITICAENATFYDRHHGEGNTAVWEPIQLARKIPYEIALRMMLLGPTERLDAERARDVGLVSQVVPADELLPTALELARRVSEGDIYAQMGTIEALYKGQELGMLQAVRQGLLIRQLQRYKKRADESE